MSIFLEKDIENICHNDPLEKNLYGIEDIYYAIEWMKKTNKIIIIPRNTLEELDNMWMLFNSMLPCDRDESDEVSINLFGINNEDNYKYLKSLIRSDGYNIDSYIFDESYECDYSTKPPIFAKRYYNEYAIDAPIYDLCESINKFYSNITSKTEATLFDKSIEYIMKKRNKFNDVKSSYIPYGDLPFFSPEEMIDLGVYNDVDADNYFGVQPDNVIVEGDFKTSDWFLNYRYNFNGIPTLEGSTMSSKWLNAIRRLYSDFDDIKKSGDINKINRRKQSILELGWNPEIDFNNENRSKANRRLSSIIESNSNTYRFVDARFPDKYLNNLNESNADSKLKPIFIILESGKAFHSEIIKKVTKSIYTHAGISLDYTLRHIYSFGAESLERLDGKKSLLGGLTREDISKYDKDMHITVFGFFVKNKDYDNIKKVLDYFIENANKLRYSYLNLISYIFKIPFNNDKRMISSQFTDRILKMSNIDISNKNSALIAPSDFEIILSNNPKIFQFFDGKVKDFKETKLKRLVNRIGNTAEPIKEIHVIKEEIENYIINEIKELSDYGYPIYESRSFPLEFDKNGNLILKGNIMNVDFESEYSKSHKILMAAEESKSYESIKYELCRLWMLNIILENKIHRSVGLKKNKEKYIKARARILNDFKKYLNLILSVEPRFNFSKYYENSPFNVDEIKVTGDTLKYSGIYIKKILNGLISI